MPIFISFKSEKHSKFIYRVIIVVKGAGTDEVQPWRLTFSRRRSEVAKVRTFHEERSPQQTRHRPGMYSSSSSSTFSSSSFVCLFVFFSRRRRICRDKGSCLLELRPK